MAFLLAITVTLIGFGLGFRGLKMPGILLALIWGLYAFEQVAQSAVPQLLAVPWFINVFFIGLAALAIANKYFSSVSFRQMRLTKAHVYVVLLFGTAYASILWTISPSFTSTFLKSSLPYLGGFVVIAPFCVFDEKQVDYAISTMVYFGALVLMAVAMGNYGYRGLQLTVNGQVTEANPLAIASFGGYVVICTVFLLYLKKYSSPVKNILHLAIIGLGLWVIVRSGSRGQLLAVVAACGIWVPITAQMSTRKSTIMAILMAVGVGFAASYFVQKMNSARWERVHLDTATEGRFDQTLYLIDYWANSSGVNIMLGLGSSASYYVVGGYPHNVPGETLAEEGLLGFFFLIGFLVSVTIAGTAWLKNRSMDRNSEFGIKVGMLLTLFTFDFGLCLKQGSLLGSPRLFCIGLCLVNFIRIEGERQKKDKRRLRAQMLTQNSMPQGEFLFEENRR